MSCQVYISVSIEWRRRGLQKFDSRLDRLRVKNGARGGQEEGEGWGENDGNAEIYWDVKEIWE